MSSAHTAHAESTGSQNSAASPMRRLLAAAERVELRVAAGRLLSVNNTLVTAHLPGARIGELVELRSTDTGDRRGAEVIALDGERAMLAPFGTTDGLSTKTEVIALRRTPEILVGNHLLGTVMNAFGRIDFSMLGTTPPPPGPDSTVRTLYAAPPDPMRRPRITQPFSVGIRSIDGLLTCGVGQRFGIYGNAGMGKSTLMSSIVANCKADVVVAGLIGERGREVGDFVSRTLSSELASRSIVVASTSDRPPVERVHAALVATAVAEHFRDQGKHVLLVIDSVTRVARALRDLGLSANEPPTRRGFTPSVFSALPRLFERTGQSARGAITAFYTVLVEGNADMDPVAEETRAMLDGHIVLSSELAAKGHYPAIDILTSRSRVMQSIIGPSHTKSAARVRELIAKHREIELLLQVGEYKNGSDPLADEAIAKINSINSYLKQGAEERSNIDQAIAGLAKLAP